MSGVSEHCVEINIIKNNVYRKIVMKREKSRRYKKSGNAAIKRCREL